MLSLVEAFMLSLVEASKGRLHPLVRQTSPISQMPSTDPRSSHGLLSALSRLESGTELFYHGQAVPINRGFREGKEKGTSVTIGNCSRRMKNVWINVNMSRTSPHSSLEIPSLTFLPLASALSSIV